MWPHGRRLCHCAMHHHSGTPMCSCNWSAGGRSTSTSTSFSSSPTSSSYAHQQQALSNKCTMSLQWYPSSASNFNFVTDTIPSNSREMRNRAEKLRRDKLNSYISELSTLVPMVAGSAKRMDKTSILRLTATHLRIYHTLLNDTKPRNEFNMVDQMALEQIMCEQLEGFLLILTPNGKIVFVSHTVEQILGHLQTDLMGQSIYTITSAEDHDTLRLHLSLDIIDVEWRRYFKLRMAKAGPRTESPTYEHFDVMGMIRPSHDGRNAKQSLEIASTSNKANNNVFAFFGKLYRPPPLSDMLIEANKDEYITRHLIDGRIINCDHRISFVAGYMIEEISGLSAFRFMHKEDVRWTMIALRQMYDRGESVGWSCYRLLSRTGQFIYLRTLGYLEVDNNGVVESFVCVNTLVTENEGVKLIKEMKERYSVMINATSTSELTDREPSRATVEDPIQLDECIKHLITNHLPKSPKTENCSPKPSARTEKQDCYQTEISADPYAIKTTTIRTVTNTTKVKRVTTTVEDETIGATRKRQKRRALSSSSSDSMADAYVQDTNTSNSSSSSSSSSVVGAGVANNGNSTTTISHHTGTTICRPNVAELMHREQTTTYHHHHHRHQHHNLLSHNVGM